MSDLKKLVKEAYDELMQELEASPSSQQIEPQVLPTKRDISLGDASSQLAKSKGELATLLDKAERAGIISKKDGKVSIIDKVRYMQVIGDLPKKIKALQAKLEPDLTSDEEV